MKKILLSTLMIAICFTAFSQSMDVNSAKTFAEKWMNVSEQKSANDLTCVYTYANAEKSQEYFYIFNSKANKSFIIVSADERILPILGYSDEGCFDASNMPPNMSNWLKGYADEMDYVFSLQGIEKHPEWENTLNGNIEKGVTAVSPLVDPLKWDQPSPYNLLCPGGSVTGCVATAMAMIMKYWNHPVHGYGSSAYNAGQWGILSVNYAEAYYDWDNMPNQLYSSSTQAQKTAVATLMYHCGVSVRMQYGPESGAYTTDVPLSLKTYFGYQTQCNHKYKADYSTPDWENMMRAELDLARPMEYHGTDDAYGGHAFVLDGYNNSNQFHFNWGWSGWNNGYFTISNLNPSMYHFNTGQGAVMNIEPNWSLYCNEPNNLTGSISGSTVTLSWQVPNDDTPNVTGYEVFKNNVKIGTTTSLTYTDNNVGFGEYSYCIKATYDNGCVSEIPVCTTINSTACFPPTNLNATDDNSTVKLTWTAPTGVVGVQKYKIYRGDVLVGEATTTQYNDEEVLNGDYEYCVVAVYDATHESDGVCANVTVDEECLPPTNLDISRYEDIFISYTLTWEAPAGKTMFGYNIYENGGLVESNYSELTYTFHYSDYSGSIYGVAAVYTSCTSDVIEKQAPLGISNTNNDIKIYPNPANDYINIETEEGINNVVIYNSIGSKVFEKNTLGLKSFTIDIKDFASGMYYIQVDEKTEKIVKK